MVGKPIHSLGVLFKEIGRDKTFWCGVGFETDFIVAVAILNSKIRVRTSRRLWFIWTLYSFPSGRGENDFHGREEGTYKKIKFEQSHVVSSFHKTHAHDRL